MEEGSVYCRKVSCNQLNECAFLQNKGGEKLRRAWQMIRFAAKEAAIKAHSHRRLTFHDVVIEKRAQAAGTSFLGSGPPVARIKAATGEEEEDVSAMVSISHDGDYATAVCLAHDPSVTGP